VTGQKLVTYALSTSGGNLVATSTGTFYYFGGKMIKNAGGYITPDRVGSNGKYFPYGQERPSATTNNKEKFATYYRDSETGLDYADSRYHQPGQGRFLTPDPAGNGLNWYAYAGGDPVNHYDPNGLTCYYVDGQLDGCVDDAPQYEYTGGFEPLISGGLSGQAGLCESWGFYSLEECGQMLNICASGGTYYWGGGADICQLLPGGGNVGAGTGNQVGGADPGAASSIASITTKHALMDSAGFLANEMEFSEGCANALQGINRDGFGSPTIDGLRAAASLAIIRDYRSADIGDDWRMAFRDQPRLYMMADIPNTPLGVGILRTIAFRPGYEVGKEVEEVRAAVMHELLHNMGFGDEAVQRGLARFGVPVDPLDTDNITRKLRELCF